MTGARVGLDSTTAVHYLNRVTAEIKLALKQVGKPIPQNDLWIAATCRRHGLTLATSDAHFGHCPGLAVEDWLQPLPPSP